MTGIDDLPADQRAVLRLLLDQHRSYQEIATTLKMAPAAVRDRAHDALNAVGPPDTPLGRERRAQVADWLLGQQTAAETETTEDLLRGSASARAWARQVCGEIEPLAGRPLPELPGTTEGTARSLPETRPASLLVDDDEAVSDAAALDEDGSSTSEMRSPGRTTSLRGMERPSSRRGGAVLLAVLALLVAVGAGVLIGRATKDGGDDKAAATTPQSSNINVLGQTNLRPPAGAPDKDAVGIAQFVERKAEGKDDPEKLLNVIAQGLPRAPEGSGYGIWLTKSGADPVWLGYFQAVTTTGEVGAQSALKVEPKGYERVILTRQRGQKPTTPGTVYLQGAVSLNAPASG